MGLNTPPADIDDWRDLLYRLRNPEHEVSIAVVGKYAEHRDAYKSIYEALDHAGIHHRAQVRIQSIQSELIEREGPERLLSGFDGVLVPGGFGERGIEGKVEAIRFARERGIPFFGICLGMQCAVIEFGRNVVGLGSAPFDGIQQRHAAPGDLPAWTSKKPSPTKAAPCGWAPRKRMLDPASQVAHSATAAEIISERHRHRYEFNNAYRSQFEAHGMLIAATSPDHSLVEIIELPEHPWFVAVQFHPEFKSKPTEPHPLFAGFIGAAVEKRATGQWTATTD